MAIRSADLALSLTPPDVGIDLNSVEYQPLSACIGPFAGRKNLPEPVGDSGRWKFLVGLQSHHNMSLVPKGSSLIVPPSTDQMLGAAPVLPDLINIAPVLLESQVHATGRYTHAAVMFTQWRPYSSPLVCVCRVSQMSGLFQRVLRRQQLSPAVFRRIQACRS